MEAVIEHYIVSTIPMIVVAWESGTNDARKDLTRRIISSCNPAVISGRLGDIHAISLDIMSRGKGERRRERERERERERGIKRKKLNCHFHYLLVQCSL